jgi:hypothetical protein
MLLEGNCLKCTVYIYLQCKYSKIRIKLQSLYLYVYFFKETRPPPIRGSTFHHNDSFFFLTHY